MSCWHVPARFDGVLLDDLVFTGPGYAKALEAGRQLVDGHLAGGLVCGPPGVGKSVLAAAVCTGIAGPFAKAFSERYVDGERLDTLRTAATGPERERLEFELASAREAYRKAERILDRRCPRWVNTAALLGALRREMNTQGEPRAAEAAVVEASTLGEILVLDDLGLERSSEWAREVIDGIVAQRYDAGARTLVTSNLSPAALQRAGLGRIVSRLAEDGVVLELRSLKDFRATKRRSVA